MTFPRTSSCRSSRFHCNMQGVSSKLPLPPKTEDVLPDRCANHQGLSSARRRSSAMNGANASNPMTATPALNGAAQTEEDGASQYSNLVQSNETVDNTHSLGDSLSDDRLWLLLRRFDKVCNNQRQNRTNRRLTEKEIFMLRAVEESGNEDLDLRLSPEARFSSNKLRSQLERLYLGVVSCPSSFANGVSD